MSAVPRINTRWFLQLPVVMILLGVALAAICGLLGGPLWLRAVASCGGLVVAVSGWYLYKLVACRHWKRCEAFLQTLSRMDYTELLASDLDKVLPKLPPEQQGRAVWHDLRNAVVRWAQRVQGAEQARAAAELRLRAVQTDQEQVRAVLNQIRTPVLGVNSFGEIVLANAAAGELFHLPDINQHRLKCQDCFPDESVVEFVLDVGRRKGPGQRSVEIELAEPDGTRRHFAVVCRSLPTAAESPQSAQVVVMLHDTSDQKATQKRHAEFVSAVSHEMKTPLAGIRAYVELLADGDVQDEATREEFLSVINGQVDRLQRLIDNLLNLARIEAGVVEVHKRVLAANEVLLEAFQVVQPAAERKRIDLRAELSPMHLPIFADRDMLLQAAINLLSNAVKYTPDGGKVTLRSRLDDGRIVFEVEDTGVGLSPEDAIKVFEKFYRVKKDSQMASGTGLGLPLAKHIVEDIHGGSITVDSQLGKGSTFRVTLPQCRSDLPSR